MIKNMSLGYLLINFVLNRNYFFNHIVSDIFTFLFLIDNSYNYFNAKKTSLLSVKPFNFFLLLLFHMLNVLNVKYRTLLKIKISIYNYKLNYN